MRTLKTIRRPKPRQRDAGTPTRDQAITALQNDLWSIVAGVDAPILAQFSAEEREGIAREAEQKDWEARERRREPVLLERLRTRPVCTWGTIFCERPDLEDTLTPEQANTWQKWKTRRKGF